MTTTSNAPEQDLKNPSYYINRELSGIAFNRRVLLESFNPEHPLLERVKFVAIFSNNMDEFFMVRVASIKQQISLGITDTPPDGLTPREQLATIHRQFTALVEQKMRGWKEQLLPELAEAGVIVVNHADLKVRQQRKLADYFEREIFPVLTPLAFDPGHPFPHISNLSLNLAVVIKDPVDGSSHFARVKVPSTLPRLVPLNPLDPDELLRPSVQKFVWVEEVIVANLARLFPGMEIVTAYPFRVTRNTDMEIQEDEADDLLLTMEENLRLRHFGFVVRLEVDDRMPDWIREILAANLQVQPHDIYVVDGPLGLDSLFELHKLDRPDLKDTPHTAVFPPPLSPDHQRLFDTLRRQDVLLNHPYDSFRPVIDFVEHAANDPDVLAIKQTLYRVGPNSPIVHALMRARENGKQVTVLVELKARFDEESNIEWARALENVGVHVVYGLLGLKTHAKICLVVRREKEGIRRYVHLGTGNYNAITGRIYTDLGLMTSDEEIGADATELFNYLTGYSRQKEYRKFWVAPVTLREEMMRQIAEEAEHGREGHIIWKINHLVDPRIIRALYRASQAGVKIQLMIRGICALRPGIPGISENITVTATIGRFLEHNRIYYFQHGGPNQLRLGSADLMPRNLDRRVEIIFPITDPELRQEIMTNIIEIYLNDTHNGYELLPTGEYVRRTDQLAEGQTSFSAQEWFLKERRTLLQVAGFGQMKAD
jgi:polyphosphate kinase